MSRCILFYTFKKYFWKGVSRFHSMSRGACGQIRVKQVCLGPAAPQSPWLFLSEPQTAILKISCRDSSGPVMGAMGGFICKLSSTRSYSQVLGSQTHLLPPHWDQLPPPNSSSSPAFLSLLPLETLYSMLTHCDEPLTFLTSQLDALTAFRPTE